MSTVVNPEICPLPRVKLVEADGENLDSDWHRLAISLLLDVIAWFRRGRTDYFAGGNMFIYFNEEQARNRDFRGPDFFLVDGRPLEPPRDYWAIWLEGGRYPDLIIELCSPSTMVEDLTTKKDIYERVFHTYEYFCYDPLEEKLLGWRLINHRYEALVPDERGWIWSEQLGLWVGTWKGKFQERERLYLRFFDKDGNVVPTAAEFYQQQAESVQRQAEAERQRAEAAEAELARLKSGLPGPDNGSR